MKLLFAFVDLTFRDRVNTVFCRKRVFCSFRLVKSVFCFRSAIFHGLDFAAVVGQHTERDIGICAHLGAVVGCAAVGELDFGRAESILEHFRLAIVTAFDDTFDNDFGFSLLLQRVRIVCIDVGYFFI